MFIPRAGFAPACLLLLVSANCAYAGEELTLGAAIERVQAASPALAAHAADSEVARARAARQSLAPPLTLGAEIENVAGSGELRGFDSAESTLQVSRLIELGGKRQRRRELGAAQVAQVDHALASARLEARSLTTERFVEVVADQERLTLAAERVALAEQTRAEVERVVRNARNAETDLRAAEIFLADAELEREHAEHELRAARVTLASTWGTRQPDFASAAMSLYLLAEPGALEELAARLPDSLALHSLKLDATAASARQQVAAAESHPDLNLSLGVRRLEAFGEQGLVMAVSMPLGVGSRARFALAESRAESTALTRRREAAQVDSYQQLFERYQELGHARTEFHALTESMIPKAQQALALATRGFDLGRFPFTALSQAQETVFELRRRRIDAAARHHSLFADIQRLTGAAEAP